MNVHVLFFENKAYDLNYLCQVLCFGSRKTNMLNMNIKYNNNSFHREPQKHLRKIVKRVMKEKHSTLLLKYISKIISVLS